MSGKILVADDESHILNVVSVKLRNAGFEVITARDGGAAYDAVLQHRPQLVITDYHMPVMSGLELCRRLREESATPPVAILLTARGSDVDPDELIRSGVVAVISKPFSPRELLATVTSHLRAA